MVKIKKILFFASLALGFLSYSSNIFSADRRREKYSDETEYRILVDNKNEKVKKEEYSILVPIPKIAGTKGVFYERHYKGNKNYSSIVLDLFDSTEILTRNESANTLEEMLEDWFKPNQLKLPMFNNPTKFYRLKERLAIEVDVYQISFPHSYFKFVFELYNKSLRLCNFEGLQYCITGSSLHQSKLNRWIDDKEAEVQAREELITIKTSQENLDDPSEILKENGYSVLFNSPTDSKKEKNEKAGKKKKKKR